MHLLRHEFAAGEGQTEPARILVVTVLSEFAIHPISGTSNLAAALPLERREAFMHQP